MRRTALFLAATLTAAVPFTLNAGQAAAGCDNPDDLEVLTVTADEPAQAETITFVGTPTGNGVYTGPDYIVDLPTSGIDDVIFEIRAYEMDTYSDYDLEIVDVPNDTVLATGESSDGGVETATVTKMDDCLHVEVGIFNFLGSPYNEITLTVSLA